MNDLPDRRCRTCGKLKAPDAYNGPTARRCDACRDEHVARRSGTRRCAACSRARPVSAYRGPLARKCDECIAAVATRECRRCHEHKPVSGYVRRGTVCSDCRKLPHPSDARIRPRACLRCFEVKAPDAFDFGPSGNRRYGVCRACREAERQAKHQRRATFVRDGVTVRRCCVCRETFPLESGFYIRKRWDDGRVDYDHRCKPCHQRHTEARRKRQMQDPQQAALIRRRRAAATRRWIRMNPEASRAAQKRYYDKVMADPRRRQEIRENERIRHRLARERAGTPLTALRSASTAMMGHDELPRLPVGPLAEVIRRLVRREELAGNPEPFECVCRLADVEPRTAFAWLTGERRVMQFDVAERVLVALGLLWFDVWGEDDPVARRAFEGEFEAVAA